MLAIASQIILCLVLAALLGMIIGYLLGKMNCPKSAYKSMTPHDPHTHDDGDCGDKKSSASSDTDNKQVAVAAKSSASNEPQALLGEPKGDKTTKVSEPKESKTDSEPQAEAVNKTEASASDAKGANAGKAPGEAVGDKSAKVSTKDDKPSGDASAKAANAKPANTAGNKATTKQKDNTKKATKPQDAKKKQESKGAANPDTDKLAGKAKNPTKQTKGQSATKKIAKKDTQVEAPSDNDKPKSLIKAPRNGKKDNLTRIKGIGVKIDQLLNDMGVYHFDQIAAWTEKEAEWIDYKISFPGRAKREDWVGQAKLLAAGKETEFSKRVDAGEVSSSKKS